jgi:hypothetical protein
MTERDPRQEPMVGDVLRPFDDTIWVVWTANDRTVEVYDFTDGLVTLRWWSIEKWRRRASGVSVLWAVP